jgi:hypothetical protein
MCLGYECFQNLSEKQKQNILYLKLQADAKFVDTVGLTI